MWTNTGSDNGLLPDSIKPSTEAILNYHLWSSPGIDLITFSPWQRVMKWFCIISLKHAVLKLLPHLSGLWVNMVLREKYQKITVWYDTHLLWTHACICEQCYHRFRKWPGTKQMPAIIYANTYWWPIEPIAKMSVEYKSYFNENTSENAD